MMTVKQARRAIRSAKQVLAYVVVGPSAGVRIRITKVEALAALDGWREDDETNVSIPDPTDTGWEPGTVLIN